MTLGTSHLRLRNAEEATVEAGMFPTMARDYGVPGWD